MSASLWLSVPVCVCPLAYFKNTHPNFSKCSVHVTMAVTQLLNTLNILFKYWVGQLTFITETSELLAKSCAKFDSLFPNRPIQCAYACSLEKVNSKVLTVVSVEPYQLLQWNLHDKLCYVFLVLWMTSCFTYWCLRGRIKNVSSTSPDVGTGGEVSVMKVSFIVRYLY